jgi:hypothetical protein
MTVSVFALLALVFVCGIAVSAVVHLCLNSQEMEVYNNFDKTVAEMNATLLEKERELLAVKTALSYKERDCDELIFWFSKIRELVNGVERFK